MHVTDTILFSSLPLIMRKTSVKFHLDPHSTFKSGTDGRTETEEDKCNLANSFELSNTRVHFGKKDSRAITCKKLAKLKF